MGWVLFCAVAAGCGGGAEDDDVDRLPLVNAPLDTIGVVETVATPDSGVVASSAEIDLAEPDWITATLPGFPPAKDLKYTRYENSQYRYSLAYPDSLFGPVQPIGEGRGMEFSTSDSTARILVYADEESSQDDLEEQYHTTLQQPDGRVTYRARESTWYIISGTANERTFYEKGVLSEGMLRTLRIEYPASRRGYFDAVTAVMSASFE